MLKRNRENNLIRILLMFLLIIYVLYNFPFLRELKFEMNQFQELFGESDNLLNPVLNSILFATFMALLNVGIALLLSTSLIKIKLDDKSSRFLSILIIPTILGSSSIAFIYKIILFDYELVFLNSITKFLTLSLIQIWQYGSLFIYLFWLNQQTIPSKNWEYASAVGLNQYEKIRDLLFPKQRNLAVLLFIVAFIFSFFEDAKIQFIFKASRGTNTELANHWLNRTFNANSLLNSDFAFKQLSISSFFVSIAALVSLILLLLTFVKLFDKFTKKRHSFSFIEVNTNWISKFILILLTCWIVIPILFVLLSQRASFQFNSEKLVTTLVLTFIAALLLTLISVLFSLLSRLLWKKTLQDFNSKSLIIFLVLYSLIMIPPIVFLILGFKWMNIIGYNASYVIFISWILGHIILGFPLITSFSLATYFRVKTTHIDYLKFHKLGLKEKIRDLFYKPFKADYLLLLILSYSMIWNESTINNVLSDSIASFVTELKMTITGKSADYANGMTYLYFSLVLSATGVIIWNYLISKNINKLN